MSTSSKILRIYQLFKNREICPRGEKELHCIMITEYVTIFWEDSENHMGGCIMDCDQTSKTKTKYNISRVFVSGLGYQRNDKKIYYPPLTLRTTNVKLQITAGFEIYEKTAKYLEI